MWIADLEIWGSSYAQICLELQLMFRKLQFGIRIMKTFFSTPVCFSIFLLYAYIICALNKPILWKPHLTVCIYDNLLSSILQLLGGQTINQDCLREQEMHNYLKNYHIK